MRLEEGWLPAAPARLGRVLAELSPLPPGNERSECRNNRLMLFAMEQIRDALERALQRFGRRRIGVVLGTSTSGIDEAEKAISEFVSLLDDYHRARGGRGLKLDGVVVHDGPKDGQMRRVA